MAAGKEQLFSFFHSEFLIENGVQAKKVKKLFDKHEELLEQAGVVIDEESMEIDELGNLSVRLSNDFLFRLFESRQEGLIPVKEGVVGVVVEELQTRSEFLSATFMNLITHKNHLYPETVDLRVKDIEAGIDRAGSQLAVVVNLKEAIKAGVSDKAWDNLLVVVAGDWMLGETGEQVRVGGLAEIFETLKTGQENGWFRFSDEGYVVKLGELERMMGEIG